MIYVDEKGNKMTQIEIECLAMDLRAAAYSVETYGERMQGAIIAAKVYALLANNEGDLEALIADIRNEVEKGKN